MAKPKRFSSSSDEEIPPKKRKPQEDDTDSEETEDEGEQVAPTKISKLDFLPFIQDLEKYGHEKLKNQRGKLNMTKLASSIPELDKYNNFYNQSSFNSDFNALYLTASRRKNVAMETTVLVMNRYLNDGHTVEQFIGFPKTPKLPVNVYIAKKRSSGASSLEEAVKLRKEFASGTVNTKTYVDQYNKDCKRYVEELQEYMEKNSNKLLESHIKHIKHLVTRYEKVYSEQPKTVNNRKKKIVKTAYDWFKDANKDYHADIMDAEKRERKLQRKFDRLGEEERRIYENIAKNNS